MSIEPSSSSQPSVEEMHAEPLREREDESATLHNDSPLESEPEVKFEDLYKDSGEIPSSQPSELERREDEEEMENITFLSEATESEATEHMTTSESIEESNPELREEASSESIEESIPEVREEVASESIEESNLVDETVRIVSEATSVSEATVVSESTGVSEATAETVEPIHESREDEPSHPLDTLTAPIIEDRVPRIVFIVPYRDREQHYKVFSSHMASYLQNIGIPYKIFYIHQTDSRGFNRGAMKNIGFIKVKQDYPEDYKNISLVFNDIDTLVANTTSLPFETTRGTIKHFYGFEHTLGGIVSITGADFERLNGFPNFWAWGYEDNLLLIRAQNKGIQIDRSVFYKISDPAIIRLTENFTREVNRAEYDRFVKRTLEGISSICDLDYTVNHSTGFVDVLSFNTNAEEQLSQRKDYDLRNGPVPFKDILRRRQAPRMKMHF